MIQASFEKNYRWKNAPQHRSTAAVKQRVLEAKAKNNSEIAAKIR